MKRKHAIDENQWLSAEIWLSNLGIKNMFFIIKDGSPYVCHVVITATSSAFDLTAWKLKYFSAYQALICIHE